MTDNCLFCRIANGRSDTEFIYETPEIVVFDDIHPHAPVHLLIVPRKHVRSVNDIDGGDMPLVAEMIRVAQRMAARTGVKRSGYKLLFNVERGGGQVIFHLHLHLMGGWR